MTPFFLGFSGSRRGLTPWQRARVRALLVEMQPDAVLHGCCVGADDECDAAAADLHIGRHGFPSTVVALRVPDLTLVARGGSPLTLHVPQAPLARNQLIVRLCHALIACPSEATEQVRSGTWATVRYARVAGKLHEVILPDGPGI